MAVTQNNQQKKLPARSIPESVTAKKSLMLDGQVVYINLTNSTRRAIIDKEDYDLIIKYKWRLLTGRKGDFYAMRYEYCLDVLGLILTTRVVFMHRVIMGLSKECKQEVDHINRNTLDNRRNNLRICNHRENTRNRKPEKNTSSKYKGVYLDKKSKLWIARISCNGKEHRLGKYKDENMAAQAYNIAAKRYYGEVGGGCFLR